MKTVLVTGGFDPLHSGHIEYFKEAKKLGDKLIVGLNTDTWLENKKGQAFMPFEERANIVKHLEMVDDVILVEDDETGGTTKAIGYLLQTTTGKLIVANGGDRVEGEIPEQKMYGDNKDVDFVFSVGGDDKKNSSSWILSNWEKPVTKRAWGSYKILDRNGEWQVKELSFEQGRALSDQRHFSRSEHWHVVDGVIVMMLEDREGRKTTRTLIPGDSIDIPTAYWHKAINIGNNTAKVIEVWLGKELTENDIERRD
jgi:D-beta-D-heptose 7-phosphate kinase/D-beta-D-heptose 1-phosphate adenosyltransferase